MLWLYVQFFDPERPLSPSSMEHVHREFKFPPRIGDHVEGRADGGYPRWIITDVVHTRSTGCYLVAKPSEKPIP